MLVVDNFGVKYVTQDVVNHLILSIKSAYMLTEDWTRNLYCGITRKWGYANRTVNISMLGYIKKKLQSNPAVEFAIPIYGEFIFLLDACNEVVNVFLTFVFYAKIIDDQREGDGPGGVFPKTWGLFTLKVSVRGKAFLEKFVGQDAYLGEAPHRSLHFQIYVPLKDLVFQCLLLEDSGGEEGKRDAHVFVLAKR